MDETERMEPTERVEPTERTGWRTSTKLLLGTTTLGVVLIVVGLVSGQHAVAVVGFLLLFVVASFLGLAW